MQVFQLTLFLKLQIWGKSRIKFIKGCLQVLVLNFIQYHLQTCQVMDIDFSCYPFILQFLEDLYPIALINLFDIWVGVKCWFKVLFSASATLTNDLEIKVMDLFFLIVLCYFFIEQYLLNAWMDFIDTWSDDRY